MNATCSISRQRGYLMCLVAPEAFELNDMCCFCFDELVFCFIDVGCGMTCVGCSACWAASLLHWFCIWPAGVRWMVEPG